MTDIVKAFKEEMEHFHNVCNELSESGDELFEMTNLFSRNTKLPFTIWISPKGKAKHGPRIKVDAEKEVVISIEDEPKILHGELKAKEFNEIKQWILNNKIALIRHWDGETDGTEVVKELKND